MAIILSPNKNYTGVSAGVQFIDGVGETDKPHLIVWFKRKGYIVEDDMRGKPPDKRVKKRPNAEETGA